MSFRSSISNKIKLFEKKFDVYNNIYISRSAILNNFDIFTKLSPGGFVIPVLKSNAYGHGLQQITEILKARRFPYVAVDGYFEGLKIHEMSKQPVLVMGAIKNSNYDGINPRGYAFVVHDIDSVRSIGQTKKKFLIHIELETGMGRHGVRIDELNDLLNEIKKYKNIIIDGAMTHLADADNPKSVKHVNLQTSRFDIGVKMIIDAGFNPKYIHIAQSAGSVKVKSKYANSLRIGIAMYGITPLELNDKLANKLHDLRPALRLTSTIDKVLNVDCGETVSYSRTFTAKRNSRIGILPLGYYEGLPRALSNIGRVRWRNKYLPIAGRVCMNHTMINITDCKAKKDDEVIIISNNPQDQLSLNNICQQYGLFNYGVLVSLNQNIRRTIVE